MRHNLVRSSSEGLLLQEKEVISKMRKYGELVHDLGMNIYYIAGKGAVSDRVAMELQYKNLIFPLNKDNDIVYYTLTGEGKTIEI